MTISNDGLSDLDFDISIQPVAAQAGLKNTHSRYNSLNLDHRLKVNQIDKTLPSKSASSDKGFDISKMSWGELSQAERVPTSPIKTSPIENSKKLQLPIVIEDPVGDGGAVDVTVLRGASTATELQIEIEFSTVIDPSDFGGVLSLDIDQDITTGFPPSFWNSEQVIGAEFEFLFFSLSAGVVDLIDTITGDFIGSYAVNIQAQSLSFSAPLSDLGNDDGVMDVTGVLGTGSGATYWFPDQGHGTIGVNWLAVNPPSGSVPAGGSLNVEVTFDATGLFGGEYNAVIIISSNDPDEPEVVVPAHLQVTGAPDIAVSNDTLDYGPVFLGAAPTRTLIISNVGTDLLTVSDISSDNSTYTVDITSFSLNPGESQEILVTFTPN